MLFSGIPVKQFENSWDRMLTRQLCKKMSAPQKLLTMRLSSVT